MSIFFPTTITYKQVTGKYVNGVWQKTEVEDTFLGNVQPITGRELESLNIGRADLGKIKIYSNIELHVSKKGSTNSGDVILYQNKKYEIIQIMSYQNNLVPHYKSLAEYRGEV